MITLPTSGDMINLTNDNNRLVHVIPGGEDINGGAKYFGLFALPNVGLIAQTKTDLNGRYSV